jgi:hypothetical protein
MLMNPHTGEVLPDSDWVYVDDLGRTELSVRSKTGQFSQKDIKAWTRSNTRMPLRITAGNKGSDKPYGLVNNRNKTFTKVHHIPVDLFDTTLNELWFRRLCDTIEPNTNIIRVMTSNNRWARATTKKDLMRIVNAKPSGFYRFYNRLLERNLIGEIRDSITHYCINPTYASSGKWLPAYICNLFNLPSQH